MHTRPRDGQPDHAGTSADQADSRIENDGVTSSRGVLDTPALASRGRICWIAPRGRGRTEARMVPFFVQIKCQLGKSYEVANKLADAELASEIYSTAGDFDLLVKFYVEEKTDIGHFVNEKVQTIPGIQDTRTIITFKAF
jgi:DNA-binding Lrp family transcriptional regulator